MSGWVIPKWRVKSSFRLPFQEQPGQKIEGERCFEVMWRRNSCWRPKVVPQREQCNLMLVDVPVAEILVAKI
jgi:hypothetical protein